MSDQEAVVRIKAQLLKKRHALLDLSTRNRRPNLLSTPRNVQSIEIVDKRTAEENGSRGKNRASPSFRAGGLADWRRA